MAKLPEATSSDRILKSALELFSSKGYEAASVREICEASGLTKPTLYHFYGSKEGVYRALVDGALDGFRSRMQADLGEPGSAYERLKRMARGYFAYAEQNQELTRFLFAMAHNTSSEAPKTDFNKFYEGVIALVAETLDQGVAAGELRPGRTDIRLLTLMGALGEALCGRLMTGAPELKDDLADALVDSLLEGWSA